jgi:hypothetical protein
MKQKITSPSAPSVWMSHISNKEAKSLLRRLKVLITKDFGKKCPIFTPICAECIVWRCVEDLEKLFLIK